MVQVGGYNFPILFIGIIIALLAGAYFADIGSVQERIAMWGAQPAQEGQNLNVKLEQPNTVLAYIGGSVTVIPTSQLNQTWVKGNDNVYRPPTGTQSESTKTLTGKSVAETFTPTGLYQSKQDWVNDGIKESVVYKNRQYDLVGNTYDQKILLKKAELKALVNGLSKEAFSQDLKVVEHVQSGVTTAFSSTNPLYYQDEDGNRLVPVVDEDQKREVYVVDKTTDSLTEDGKKWNDIFATSSTAGSSSGSNEPSVKTNSQTAQQSSGDGGLTGGSSTSSTSPGSSGSTSGSSGPADGGLT